MLVRFVLPPPPTLRAERRSRSSLARPSLVTDKGHDEGPTTSATPARRLMYWCTDVLVCCWYSNDTLYGIGSTKNDYLAPHFCRAIDYTPTPKPTFFFFKGRFEIACGLMSNLMAAPGIEWISMMQNATGILATYWVARQHRSQTVWQKMAGVLNGSRSDPRVGLEVFQNLSGRVESGPVRRCVQLLTGWVRLGS